MSSCSMSCNMNTFHFSIYFSISWKKKMNEAWLTTKRQPNQNSTHSTGRTSCGVKHSEVKINFLIICCLKVTKYHQHVSQLKPASIPFFCLAVFISFFVPSTTVCSKAVKLGGRMRRWKATKKRKHVGNCFGWSLCTRKAIHQSVM